MKYSEDILSELKEISPLLAEIEKTNVYTIPDDYFSGLSQHIVEKAKNATSLILPASDTSYLASETRFLDVPEGYFDNLSENILKRIKNLQADDANEELKQLSPMLYAVQNENVFSTPEKYFEKLTENILNSIPSRGSEKVISIKKRSTVWNYAVAAMLTGAMAISALWITDKSFKLTPVISGVKDVPSYIIEASQFKNERQINEGIASLSDDEIINFLEVTGTTADDELLITGMPDNELPAVHDYLLDENTLNTYLDKINSKNHKN